MGQEVKHLFDGDEPRRQDAWDRDHMRTVSTHLYTEEEVELLLACMEEKTTRYALLQRLVREWLRGRK